MTPQGGLQPTIKDERDFQLGQITKLPPLEELPPEYKIEAIIKNQGGSDFCSAYMSCAMSEPQEGLALSSEYSFALSKEISGDLNDWGQQIRPALKAHTEVGGLERTLSPYTVDSKSSEFLRDIKNWPDLKEEAYPHRKKSYFKITGQYDNFDNARASLWKFKSPIGTGVLYGWSLATKVFDIVLPGGFGHAMTMVGFTTLEDGREALIVQNSYGKEAGEGGYHYITREVYNYFSERYGAYMFVDIPKEQAKEMIEKGIILGDNWLIQLLKAFISLIKNIWHASS